MLSNVRSRGMSLLKGAKMRQAMSTAQKTGGAALSIEAIDAKRVIAEGLGFKDAKVCTPSTYSHPHDGCMTTAIDFCVLIVCLLSRTGKRTSD